MSDNTVAWAGLYQPEYDKLLRLGVPPELGGKVAALTVAATIMATGLQVDRLPPDVAAMTKEDIADTQRRFQAFMTGQGDQADRAAQEAADLREAIEMAGADDLYEYADIMRHEQGDQVADQIILRAHRAEGGNL